MSMIMEMRKCPKCKKEYSFNPDIGKGLFCPHCAGIGEPPKSTFEKIMRRMDEKKRTKKS